jgi:hypothetical protein
VKKMRTVFGRALVALGRRIAGEADSGETEAPMPPLHALVSASLFLSLFHGRALSLRPGERALLGETIADLNRHIRRLNRERREYQEQWR